METDDEHETIREILRKLLIGPYTLFIDYTDIVPAKDTIHLKIFKIIYFNQGRLTDAPLPRTIIQWLTIILPTNDKSESLKRKPLDFGARQGRISQSSLIEIRLFSSIF